MCAVKLINKKKVDATVLQHEIAVLRRVMVSFGGGDDCRKKCNRPTW